MKVTVLGSGSIISSAERGTAGFLVEAGEQKIALDFGFGCFKSLKSVCNPSEVSAFLFSHFDHADHSGELPSIVLFKHVAKDNSQLNLFGPKGIQAFQEKLFGSFSTFGDLAFKIKATELEYSSVKEFGFLVKTKPMKHNVSSIGFRIEHGGKILAYSGDTGYCDEIIDLGKNADLLILECTYEKKGSNHLTPEECAQIAGKAKAKTLLLCHISEQTEKLPLARLVKPLFSGKVLIAKDLMELKL